MTDEQTIIADQKREITELNGKIKLLEAKASFFQAALKSTKESLDEISSLIETATSEE